MRIISGCRTKHRHMCSFQWSDDLYRSLHVFILILTYVVISVNRQNNSFITGCFVGGQGTLCRRIVQIGAERNMRLWIHSRGPARRRASP